MFSNIYLLQTDLFRVVTFVVIIVPQIKLQNELTSFFLINYASTTSLVYIVRNNYKNVHHYIYL